MSCFTFDQIPQAIHDSGGKIDGRTTKFLKVLVGEDSRDVISYSHILDRLGDVFESLVDLFSQLGYFLCSLFMRRSCLKGEYLDNNEYARCYQRIWCRDGVLNSQLKV
jgi:hypothetical protein